MVHRAIFFSTLFVSFAGCGGPRLTASRGNLVVTPGAVDFGEVALGVKTTRTIELKNTGESKISIKSMAISAKTSAVFRLLVPLPSVIEASGTQTVTVEYGPLAPGADSASIEIESDANNAPSALVALIGHAVSTSGSTDGGLVPTDAGALTPLPDGGTIAPPSADAGDGAVTVDAGGLAIDAGVPGFDGGVDAGPPKSDSGVADAGNIDAGPCFWTVELLAGNDQVVGGIVDGTGPAASIEFAQDLFVDPVFGDLLLRENRGPIRRASQTGVVTTISSGRPDGIECEGYPALAVDVAGGMLCMTRNGFYRLNESDGGWSLLAPRPRSFGTTGGLAAIGLEAYHVSYNQVSDGGLEVMFSRWPFDGGPGVRETSNPGNTPRFLVIDSARQKLNYTTGDGTRWQYWLVDAGYIREPPSGQPRVGAYDHFGNAYNVTGRINRDGGYGAKTTLPFITIAVDDDLTVYGATRIFTTGSAAAIYRLSGCQPAGLE